MARGAEIQGTLDTESIGLSAPSISPTNISKTLGEDLEAYYCQSQLEA